ncbi:unnamed protein product [Mucor hiemalis]
MVFHSDTLYCSVYASHEVPTMLLLQALDYVLEQTYTHIVIAGDFNVNFEQESSKKTTLLSMLNQHGLKSTLPNTIRSSTKESALIDNITHKSRLQKLGQIHLTHKFP